MLLNLSFASNTILSCLFFFFLINGFFFSLILAVIAQIFIPTAELTIQIGILTKETKAEMEAQKQYNLMP